MKIKAFREVLEEIRSWLDNEFKIYNNLSKVIDAGNVQA